MIHFETECREMAQNFPTPNVLKAIGHAERGEVTWADLHALFTRSLNKALAEVN